MKTTSTFSFTAMRRDQVKRQTAVAAQARFEVRALADLQKHKVIRVEEVALDPDYVAASEAFDQLLDKFRRLARKHREIVVEVADAHRFYERVLLVSRVRRA